MSDHPKISIISTVYNTGPYLRPAVESILAQTFTDFELLLVDDGSHDGSAEVCDALAGQDARIRVFHQPNGGPAHARNTGLDNACGDYIGIVDSDDLIEPAMFETLYNAVQQPGVRLAACAADCIDAEGRRIEGRSVTIRQPGVRDAQELLLEAFQTGSFYGPLSWNKLFDARLFREKGIHYDETMLFGDDASVLHRVFEGERCNCLTDVLYHYRTRAGQITTAGFPPRKTDDLRMYWEWLQYFSARPGREEYYEWAVVRYWRIFYQFWCQSDAAGNLPELKPKFMAHKKHLDAILPDILSSRHLPLGEKLPSVRELSTQLTINPNTIQRAYHELETEGYICSVAGRGSYVCAQIPDDPARQVALLQQFDAAVQELLYLGMRSEELRRRIPEGGTNHD